jgi:membrane-associated PAP2 superfamily phosphatase
MTFKFILHYGLHFIAPAFIAYFFFRKQWLIVYAILILTMLVDLDHLLANPIFDPNRCSVGFHPLHSYWAITIYFIGLFFKKTRVIAIGLLLHMIADWVDCFI